MAVSREHLAGMGDWQQRLTDVVELMREMSSQTDPQAMVRSYIRRVGRMMPVDRFVSLSRRDLQWPHYRITRSNLWTASVNPWKEKGRLPLLEGGLLAELIYGNEPRIVDRLEIHDDDPAAEYFAGQHSVAAIPLYDRGEALNMFVAMRSTPSAFNREEFPELVWISNLFGRATHNLVLAEQIDAAYRLLDHELMVVAEIQRSLLPKQLPNIPTLQLAAHYQTSRRAGGDYYDFFPLPDGRWGILIADVSGHGTPAAVMMAITHALIHAHPDTPNSAGEMLGELNHHLGTRYTSDNGSFVTAFYGIYEPASHRFTYARAGHEPPRLRRGGDASIVPLDRVGETPLGISTTAAYAEASETLKQGDRLLLFTDGVTETAQDGTAAELFSTRRLDAILKSCQGDAARFVQELVAAVDQFAAGQPATDDRTLLVADVLG